MNLPIETIVEFIKAVERLEALDKESNAAALAIKERLEAFGPGGKSYANVIAGSWVYIRAMKNTLQKMELSFDKPKAKKE